jgi:alpha-tubulin suppressor-like RCC1 family protein
VDTTIAASLGWGEFSEIYVAPTRFIIPHGSDFIHNCSLKRLYRHRINTSEFKHVEFLQGKTVVQVACGQQHTVCRVIDNRSEYAQRSCPAPGGGPVAIGADVYVFGNGALGQLGLGIRGTSKGRLLPTLIESLQHFYPKAIADVSAGGNFTVAVAADGSVWSFGHSEYNQHASAAKSDYHDPYYFYVPRRVPIKKAEGLNCADEDVFIVKVSCGFNFTLGIDAEGLAYSWGWNESGVLGKICSIHDNRSVTCKHCH